MVFKVSGADTGGVFAVVEHPIEPGRLVLPHVHLHEDEYSYVLEGTIGARVGNREDDNQHAHRLKFSVPAARRGVLPKPFAPNAATQAFGSFKISLCDLKEQRNKLQGLPVVRGDLQSAPSSVRLSAAIVRGASPGRGRRCR